MAEKPEDKRTEESPAEQSDEFRVEDRRHWAHGEEEAEQAEGEAAEVKQPTLLDEYRQRAEAAEKKLQEYIEAFKKYKEDHEEYRQRLSRDVERRVELSFGELVGELLESMDDLDLAVEHVNGVPEAEPLARGVEMARKRFLGILERNGAILMPVC
jgi:molecular chaperone GrpE